MHLSTKRRLSQALLFLIATCYLVQVLSPLRINTDAVTLLSIARSASQGTGFLDSGQKTVFPPGYPALLMGLMKVGLARSWAFIGLNLLFLAAGLFAAYTLLIRDFLLDENVVLLICSFTLLSFVVVKHSTLPLTDVPYFGCSMGCLAIMSRAMKMDWNWRFLQLVVAAWLLAIAAVAIRRVGIALVPPLIFMIVFSPRFKVLLARFSRRAKLSFVAVVGLIGIATGAVIARTSTLSDFHSVAKGARLSGLALQILSYRLMEFGELMCNMPTSKMPARLETIAPWIGLVALLLVLLGLATKRNEIGVTEVYTVCYMMILFAWPYRDTRFWLPVVPLLIAYSLRAVKIIRLPKPAVTAYCLLFGLAGFAAIFYSTRISVAGQQFPERYGDSAWRPTYCAAYQSCPGVVDPSRVDGKALSLIKEFN